MPSGAGSIATAEILSVGSELLVGETRDTNSGEIAQALSAQGVTVRRIQALPDELEVVRSAFDGAIATVDLVVSTGGLGPTPDDLTREAIAACLGEEPAVDPALEAWLRGLWARRRLPFPEINRKQAWLIPSAQAIPNENGTAPGWWVERGGRPAIIALPGPPREMRPMWQGWVLPRLASLGLGVAHEVRTLRLTGIGESQVADQLGETLLRSTNPIVATYARADAVDVRIAAVDEPAHGDVAARSALDLVQAAEEQVIAAVGDRIWARGRTTWADAISDELGRRGWTFASIESGTAGSIVHLLGSTDSLVAAEVRASIDEDGATPGPSRRARSATVARLAHEARWTRGTAVGLAVAAFDRGGDTEVFVAVATPAGEHVERRITFLGGEQGRVRAALAAADALLAALRRADPP